MAVQYNKNDNRWSGLLVDIYNAKKGIIEISDEATKFFDKTKKWKNDSLVITDEAKFNSFIKKMNLADESLIKFLKDTNYGKKDLESYQQYLKDMSGGISTFTTFTKKAGTALKSLGAAMTSMAVSWAIGKVIEIAATTIDNYIHKAEKARERTSELFDEFKEMNNTLADHKKTVSGLADRYDELSKGVNLSTNANSFLSTEEYEEFLDINEQLANSFPELVKGIAENGNSILTLGTKGITAKKQLEELLQTEEDLNNFRIAQGLDEAFKGVYTYIEDANEATTELEDSILDLNEYISGWQRVTEKGIVFEDNLYQFDGKYHESYGKYNEIQYQYMKTIEDSVDEFWKQLDKSRQAALSEKGYNLYSVDSDANGFKLYVNTVNLEPDEIAELERIIQNNITNVGTNALDSLGEQETELRKQIQNAENAWVDYLPNLISGMKSLETFKRLQTEQIYPEKDLLQRSEKCAAAMERSLENMMNPTNIIAHNMQELTGMGKYMNHINNVSSLANSNKNAQPVINGGINITCPGVTSKEVAKQLPGVLNEALEREFSGLHLQAMQWT